MRARLRGLFALLGIVGFLVGVPLLLLALGGSPLPSSLPTAAEVGATLSHPPDETFWIGLLRTIAWLAWAYFAIAMTLEVVAQLRRVPSIRVAGFRSSQGWVAGLVSTAGLLFTAAPAAFAAGAPAAAPPPAVAVEAAAAQQSTIQAPVQHEPTTEVEPKFERYRVKPGDTLWDISKKELDNPRKYPSIARASDIPDPNVIYPGQKLRIPNPDYQPTARTQHRHPNPAADAGDRPPAPGQADENDSVQGQLQPGADVDNTGRDQLQPGRQQLGEQPGHAPPTVAPSLAAAPSAATPTPSSPQPTPPAVADPSPSATVAPGTQPAAEAAAEAEMAEEVEEGFPVRTAAGIGALMAVGLLTVINVRRRRQHNRRRPGQPLPMPTGAAASAEDELRAVADSFSWSQVDLALRSLALHCQRHELPLPTLALARLTGDQLELYLADRMPPPPPWTSNTDHSVWALPLTAVQHLDPTGDTPSPYPALVTIGHDEQDGHILLDLEQVATLSVTGDPDCVRHVMTALAMELATSAWADDLQITVVGQLAELDDILQTGRVVYLPTTAGLLQRLRHRVEHDRGVLLQHDTTLPQARAALQLDGLWTPEVVLIPAGLAAGEAEELAHLMQQEPRVAVAMAVGGTVVSGHHLEIDDDDQAVLTPPGLMISPQVVPDDTYNDLLAAVETADPENIPPSADVAPRLSDVPLQPSDHVEVDDQAAELLADHHVDTPHVVPVVNDDDGDTPQPDDKPEAADVAQAADVEQAAAAQEPADVIDLRDDTPVRLEVLGPVRVLNAHGKPDERRLRSMTEIVAYLALHPGGVSMEQFNEAIWGTNRVATSTRNSQMSRTRRWTGLVGASAYDLGDNITCDWWEWKQVLPDGAAAATPLQLEQAVPLIQGRPFQDIPSDRYRWAERLQQEMITETLDACIRLAEHYLLAGRFRDVERICVTGILVDNTIEALWRARIMAAHRAGRHDEAAEAIQRMLTVAGPERDLEAETEALLRDLAAAAKR